VFEVEEFKFDKFVIKDHAVMRMINRNILSSDVNEILHSGEVIERYPDDFPFPSKLVFKIVNGRPLHIVLAFSKDQNLGIVITVYEVDIEHFEKDFKTRKK
jgi:hypothetical protein